MTVEACPLKVTFLVVPICLNFKHIVEKFNCIFSSVNFTVPKIILLLHGLTKFSSLKRGFFYSHIKNLHQTQNKSVRSGMRKNYLMPAL